MFNLFKRQKIKPEEYHLGLNKDRLDERDYLFSVGKRTDIPKSISLVDKMPEIWNQEDIGSCASFSAGRIISYFYRNAFVPSCLFLYYNVRELEGDVNKDSGSTLRGVLKSANKTGYCKESLWKYVPRQYKVKPFKSAYEDGAERLYGDKIMYYRINNVDDIKYALADGYVPIIGVNVTDSFYSDKCMKTGKIPMPKGRNYGGHALVISGYDTIPKCITGDTEIVFIIENSWGKNVGINGRFTVTDKVLEEILIDAWAVRIEPDNLSTIGDVDGKEN